MVPANTTEPTHPVTSDSSVYCLEPWRRHPTSKQFQP
jgi:hypothetical protein